MDLSAVARRMLRVGVITALAAVTAFGVGGSASAAPAGAVSSIPSGPVLAGVSCPVVSMCMIVGEANGTNTGGFVPLAAVWNGRTWRWLAQPPQRQPDSQLAAVTCLAVSRCIAVGNSDATLSTGRGVAFGEEWNGADWRLLPPMAGPTFTSALGLSCVTASYCVAVGGSGRGGSLANAIAEFWNGASWTRLTPIVPSGATSVAFDGVSCPSKSHCQAVGSYQAKAGEFALAESWNGSTWTMQTAPSGFSAFAGVSCPAANANLCLAVGPGPTAARWNGSTWTKLTTPKEGRFQPGLDGVSCPSVTRCIAVGGTLDGPFADAWTGGVSLTKQSIPDQAGELSGLFGVSCPRSSSCLAVGSPLGEFSSFGNVAIEWNGSAWRVIRENKSDILSGVACATRSDCLAVGDYLNPSDATATLAQSWNGKAWRLKSPAGVFGDFAVDSCLTRTFCMATGPGKAATWNGAPWRVLTSGVGHLVVPGALSCPSTRFCVATDSNAIVVWKGVTWRDLDVAFPGSAATGELSGVSCTSPSFCVGVGSYSVSFEGEPIATLADVWNGTSWSLLSTPHPGIDSILTSVSCVRGSGCMAVGNYVDAHHKGHNLALRLSGSKWRVVAMPGGSGFGDPGDPASITGPSSVSCSRATSCVAVGSFPGAHGNAELADVWNGKSWRVTEPAGPATGLTTVSCASPTFCMAVGQDANLALTERWNGHSWKVLTEVNP